MRKIKRLKPVEGALFAVPLIGGNGFGYGCITLSQPGYGHLMNIYKHIGENPIGPDNLCEHDTVITDRLISGNQFSKSRNNPEEWILLNASCSVVPTPEKTIFRVGHKLYDMRTDSQITDGDLDPYDYPQKSYPLDDRFTYEITALLTGRQWRFDAEKRVYEIF